MVNVHSTPVQDVQVQAHAEDIVLSFWARHNLVLVILSEPPSTQEYQWVPVNLMLQVHVTLKWTSIPFRRE